jgi:hypothetical protein
LLAWNIDYKVDHKRLDRPLEKLIINKLKITPYNFEHANLVIHLVMYAIMALAIMFSVPVVLLLFVHTKNFLTGKPSPQNIKKTSPLD